MKMAIIKKDLRSITANRKMLVTLIVVPLVMTVFIPVVFILSIILSPIEDLKDLIKMLEAANIIADASNQRYMLMGLILNYIFPLFFMMIPIMVSSVMSASSFVGEKEKKTLETLLYCPLPLKDIFAAKILASFLLSMVVSVISFIIMLAVFETLVFIFTKTIIMPNINWLITMLLVAPAASLIAISLIVRGSAKAQSSEESQQSSLLLVMPVILLILGQFTGVMILGAHIFLILGIALATIAAFMFKSSFGKFKYETLLR